MVANTQPVAGTRESVSRPRTARLHAASRVGIGMALAFAAALMAYGAAPEPGSDLARRGQELFQKTAGAGVGCAACHGSDAYGTDRAGNIRDASAEEIKKAIRTQPAMGFFKLAEDEVQALAAYLAFIKSQ